MVCSSWNPKICSTVHAEFGNRGILMLAIRAVHHMTILDYVPGFNGCIYISLLPSAYGLNDASNQQVGVIIAQVF